ncbi:hypothetical protein D3C78_589980 [compost metagenome]
MKILSWPGARKYSSTFTRPRIASNPAASIRRFPRIPPVQTIVEALISSPDARITPFGRHSLIATPILNVTPFLVSKFIAYSTSSGANPGRAVGAASMLYIFTMLGSTSNSLHNPGMRSANSATNSIPLKPAPPTTKLICS